MVLILLVGGVNDDDSIIRAWSVFDYKPESVRVVFEKDRTVVLQEFEEFKERHVLITFVDKDF